MDMFRRLLVYSMLYIMVGVTACQSQQVQGNSLALFPTANPTDKLTVLPPSSFTNWNLTLPTTGGTANYFLQTNGSGVTTWASPVAPAVILDPLTTLRNVIKPSVDVVDLRLQNHNVTSTAYLQTWEFDNGSSITVNASMDNGGNLSSIGNLQGQTLEAGFTSSFGTLYIDDGAGNKAAFKAGASMTGNVTWSLPSADGTSGYVLKTNGAGTLSWVAQAGGSLWFRDQGSGTPSTAPVVTGPNGVAIGSAAVSSGGNAVAFPSTLASGDISFAEGNNNKATGDKTAMLGGELNVAASPVSVIIGGSVDTTKRGYDGMFATIGSTTGESFSNGPSYIIGGNNQFASGSWATTLGGQGLSARGFDQVVMGQFNQPQRSAFGNGYSPSDYALIIGNGTNSTTLSNTFVVTFNGTLAVNPGTAGPSISDGNGIDLFGKILRIRTSKTPANTAATGNQGEVCWDDNYFYVCTSAGWKRTALTTF